MGPARLERATYCLEGSCSIQLSYGQTNGAHNKVRNKSKKCTGLKEAAFLPHPKAVFGTRGFEPPIFCSQSRRLSP